MQDKMNAYNAPVAQMQRLSEAGLNPNLVYGHGGAVIESAGGNAPQPPNSAPIDTQGVLQMVQTIVGAMLEKDKIQASKEMHSEQLQSNQDIADARNATQKEVTVMQTDSSERNVDAQLQSNEDIANERNQTEKDINEERIKSNEQIEFAKLTESARQADMRDAIERGHLFIDQFMAQLAKQRTDADVSESYSRKALNDQQYWLHKELDELTVLVEQGKVREYQLRNGVTEIQDFLSRPGDVDVRQLSVLYDKYHIPYTMDQLYNIKKFKENMNGRLVKDARWNNNEVASFTKAFYDNMLSGIGVIGALVK